MIHSIPQHWPGHVLLAQQPVRSVLERLDPPHRAAVLMTILGLVLTGLALVTGVMIGAHWVRRLSRQRPYSTPPTGDPAKRSAGRRKLRSLPNVPSGPSSSVTVQMDPSLDDTRLDHSCEFPEVS